MTDRPKPDTITDHRFFTITGPQGYLNLDGSDYVKDRAYAYRGEIAQAQKMRDRVDTNLTIVPFTK